MMDIGNFLKIRFLFLRRHLNSSTYMEIFKELGNFPKYGGKDKQGMKWDSFPTKKGRPSHSVFTLFFLLIRRHCNKDSIITDRKGALLLISFFIVWISWMASIISTLMVLFPFRNYLTIMLVVVAKILLFAVSCHMPIPLAFETLNCV